MNLPKPSEAELRILNVLWGRGPSTVRQVHDELEDVTNVGYTTILKLLQIMLEKGLVERDESSHRHIYTACPTREQTQERFVDDLVESLFLGSKKHLVLQILADSSSSQQEIEEIREAIQEFEAEVGKSALHKKEKSKTGKAKQKSFRQGEKP